MDINYHRGATGSDKAFWYIHEEGVCWQPFSLVNPNKYSKRWNYSYCEEGLYALLDTMTDAIYLIEARSPEDALSIVIDRIRKTSGVCTYLKEWYL